jgi:membrane protease subunit HflK
MRTRNWIIVGCLLALGVYLACGLYIVQPGERGVVRWLGRVPQAYRRVQPGVHYALPWPICEVDKPRTTEVRRVYVGLLPAERAQIMAGDRGALLRSVASDMLTGDVNILKATMVAQYQVSEPADYLFAARDPDQLVHDTVQAVLIEELAGLPVDQLLTVAKAQLQQTVHRRTQDLLDRYGCGVQLVAANLESIEPPRAIIAAFQDVVSAKKDGEKAVDQAVSEANRILAGARGGAAEITERAEGYRQTRISRARGDAARFLSVLAEYRREPEIFRQRVLLQTLEKVLPNVRTYVLDQKPGDPQTNLKIVDTTRE